MISRRRRSSNDYDDGKGRESWLQQEKGIVVAFEEGAGTRKPTNKRGKSFCDPRLEEVTRTHKTSQERQVTVTATMHRKDQVDR